MDFNAVSPHHVYDIARVTRYQFSLTFGDGVDVLESVGTRLEGKERFQLDDFAKLGEI